MNKPLVSTITPCYRMKRYLKGFLDWLPKQTFFDKLEVVLDHNEPDKEELSWIHEFQRRYPNRLKHLVIEKVDPIGTSMNRCIREAAGEFVTIWNVDDLRTPDSIEAQARLLLDDVNVDIVYGDYSTVTSFGSTEGIVVEHDGIPESEFTRSMIFGPFFMFRKALCEKAGYFDEQLKSGADFDLAIRLSLHGKATMTHSLLGYYLNEGLGASTRPNSFQPIERTVIELRYGIYDKIDYDYIAQASGYNIPFLKYRGNWIHIKDFVPAYDHFMKARHDEWFRDGIESYCTKARRPNRLQSAIRKLFLQ